MSKSIKITENQWKRLFKKIKLDYKPSVYLIRENMKKTLGFVVRRHEEWINSPGYEGFNIKIPRDTIYLDFYDDGKKTMFLLKYSEYLNGKD